MAYINWTAGSTGLTWLQNAADAIGGVSGWTVQARAVLLTTNTWLTVVRSTPGGFVLSMVSSGTGTGTNLYFTVAEDFDSSNNTLLRRGWAVGSAPTAVHADGSFTGSAWTAITSTMGLRAASGVPFLSGAAILDTFIAFEVRGAAFVFDTAVANPSADTVRFGSIGGDAGTGFSATRIPLAGSLPSPQAIGGTVNPWVSSVLTAGPDAYNVANPTAYNFTPVVFRHGTPVGQVRGTTGNLLWCSAGVTGEEVLIPGEGTFRKMPSGIWAKVG